MRAALAYCRTSPLAEPSGPSSDIEIHAREVLALRSRVDEIYAKHTGQSVERVHADMERDRYFTAEEAVAYGLVDEILANRTPELVGAVAGYRSAERG